MPQEIIDILVKLGIALLTAIGTGIAGFIALGVKKFTDWIHKKADKRIADYTSRIMEIVGNSVKEVYQTYVEGLKEAGKFDKEAQEKALEMCVEKIKHQLAPELLDYIGKNFYNVTDYLISLIEGKIYTLKR